MSGEPPLAGSPLCLRDRDRDDSGLKCCCSCKTQETKASSAFAVWHQGLLPSTTNSLWCLNKHLEESILVEHTYSDEHSVTSKAVTERKDPDQSCQVTASAVPDFAEMDQIPVLLPLPMTALIHLLSLQLFTFNCPWSHPVPSWHEVFLVTGCPTETPLGLGLSQHLTSPPPSYFKTLLQPVQISPKLPGHMTLDQTNMPGYCQHLSLQGKKAQISSKQDNLIFWL